MALYELAQGVLTPDHVLVQEFGAPTNEGEFATESFGQRVITRELAARLDVQFLRTEVKREAGEASSVEQNEAGRVSNAEEGAPASP